jgi:hypothetical protein
MFQLFEFLISVFGAALVSGLHDTVCAAIAVTDCDECGFNDLGKLLFGGLILAVIVGILISVLRHWFNASRPDFSDSLSIHSPDKGK